MSCLAKTRFAALYNENYPECIHKIPSDQLVGINNSLCESYVDDIFSGTGLYDVKQEFTSPTFLHSFVPDLKELSLANQSCHITITKARKLIAVLDFVGFDIKKFVSNFKFIEDFLNQDTRLTIKKTNKTDLMQCYYIRRF